MTEKNKISLIFIVNGVDVVIDANVHEPLKVARDKALKDSNNTGRNMDEWEVQLTRKVRRSTRQRKSKNWV